ILNNNCISIDDIARITFNEAQSVVLADYNFAVEFNSYKTGKMATVLFHHQLTTDIEFKA
ncbi:MAG: hypothetical protein LBL90_01045, partial [Prevotellaceae bacterium]|nr:hypothetical protein [Prevotellaceae bacterium]